MTNLLELADRVEAGGSFTLEEANFIMGNEYRHASERIPIAARKGSLDAAKALHEAVLPGWEWGVDFLENESVGYVRKDHTLCEGYSNNLAAAWVAAILRAKHWEQQTPDKDDV